LNNLGQLAMLREQYAEAKTWFEHCIKTAMNQSEQHQTNLTIYHYNLAEACQKLSTATADEPIIQNAVEETVKKAI